MSKKLDKVGAKVAVKRRNGTFINGKIHDIVESKRGLWFHVNTETKRGAPPAIIKARLAQLSVPLSA